MCSSLVRNKGYTSYTTTTAQITAEITQSYKITSKLQARVPTRGHKTDCGHTVVIVNRNFCSDSSFLFQVPLSRSTHNTTAVVWEFDQWYLSATRVYLTKTNAGHVGHT